jgi:glycosyltransferase involved in cell wall biosynthesis
MKIIIIASDNHAGGGKVLINDLLSAAIKITSINFHILVDSRLDITEFNCKNMFFTKISKFKRIFYVNKIVGNLAKPEDVIINFSGLPFFKKYKCTKVQYLNNRFFIDDYSTLGLPITVRLRLMLQKLAFSVYLKKTDYIFVQNLVMKDLLLKFAIDEKKIKVIPYKDIDTINFEGQILEKSFIYVASGEAHKNHLNLVKAWVKLAEDSIYPTLYLTIEKGTSLHKKILLQTHKYNLNIVFLPKLQRAELLSYYGKVSALIYPSFFESFGIPLLEAVNSNLPIIASELDYVRDLIEPTQTFDPHSPRSIARAVKRFFGQDEKTIPVISAEDFTQELFLYANK